MSPAKKNADTENEDQVLGEPGPPEIAWYPPVTTARPPVLDEFGNTPREWVMSERWRTARAYPTYPGQNGVIPDAEKADFPLREPEGGAEDAPLGIGPQGVAGIFVKNWNGAVVEVPNDWVTIDDHMEALVYVRGHLTGIYASPQEITDWTTEFEPAPPPGNGV